MAEETYNIYVSKSFRKRPPLERTLWILENYTRTGHLKFGCGKVQLNCLRALSSGVLLWPQCWNSGFHNRQILELNNICVADTPVAISLAIALEPLWTLAAFSVSWFFTQSVGFLGRGISPSQGRYLHSEQHKHKINSHRYPCCEWDSDPRSQCSSRRRRLML
jgi:hypothetical protein